MVFLLLLLLLIFGGVSLFFSCLGTILAIAVIIALIIVASWIVLYGVIVLLVFYLIYRFWKWLLIKHPRLVQRLNLIRFNEWLIRANNGKTKQNVLILLVAVLIIIWLIRR